MKRMIGLTASVLAVLLIAAAPAVAAQKIGYVNLQKALNSSKAGQAAKEEIGEKVKEYEGIVESRQEDIRKLKSDLEKKTAMLSKEARSEKERDYQRKMKEFERFTKDIQEELQQRDADMTRGILEELFEVIQEIGEEEEYDLVLEKTESSILYADDEIDLTGKLIKAYDAQYKKAE